MKEWRKIRTQLKKKSYDDFIWIHIPVENNEVHSIRVSKKRFVKLIDKAEGNKAWKGSQKTPQKKSSKT